MPESHSFGVEPISCHSWNKDRSQVAISLNNNEVQIHSTSGGRWTLKETLSDHAQRVTGVDWAPSSNQIVTCAADRNAYVWTLTEGKWKPALVVLGITRAATCVKWSPQGNKFAVGSGNRCVSICYFDSANDWWTNKKIKKPIRSTITCLDWHPNNQILACGSTDFKARIYSACMKEVKDQPAPSTWGDKLVFANLLAEFSSEGSGWVHGIRFSGNGEKLVWVGHDSSICVVDSAKGNALAILKTEHLPFMDVTWISDNSLVVGGYDCIPLAYTYSNGSITFKNKMDSDTKQSETKRGGAMAHFRTQDSRGTDSNDTVLSSLHQNTITQLSLHTGTKDKCTKLTTSAADGLLVVWDVK